MTPSGDPSSAGQDAFRQTWDTSYVKPSERFSYFREGVCQAYWATTPQEDLDRPIDARMARAHLPRGSIAKLNVTAHRVVITKADCARQPGECFALSWFRSGGIEGTANGRDYKILADQVVMSGINAIERFHLSRPQRLCTVGMIFGRPLLRPLKIEQTRVFDRPTDAALKSCLILADSIFETASRAQLTDIFDAAVSLVNASLVRDPDFLEEDLSHESTSRRGIYVAIHNWISNSIADPRLSSKTIGGHFGITSRYVHKLFAEERTTLKSVITNLRLERVKRDLLDATKRNSAVSEIATRWGFNNMATFHRNFRRKFGDTPNQMRISRRRRLD